MTILHVTLFGRLAVRCGEQLITDLGPRKVQELFCYLLLYRDRPHHREILADLLCGDNPTSQSRKCLRQALWRLQAVLRTQAGLPSEKLLLVEADWVQINPEADVWLDVAEFEKAFALVHGVPGHELDAQRVQTLEEAVDLYQGDLLEGWYQDWCVYERERFQQMYLAMLDKLMDQCQAHQEYETGLVYGTRILRYDQARERTHRRLMRLHHLSGDRTAALRQYERCIASLEQELDVRPAKRTTALYEQIRADQLDRPTREPAQ
jgi:DNA-binding SARP family transcriptional activator